MVAAVGERAGVEAAKAQVSRPSGDGTGDDERRCLVSAPSKPIDDGEHPPSQHDASGEKASSQTPGVFGEPRSFQSRT